MKKIRKDIKNEQKTSKHVQSEGKFAKTQQNVQNVLDCEQNQKISTAVKRNCMEGIWSVRTFLHLCTSLLQTFAFINFCDFFLDIYFKEMIDKYK